MSLAVSMAGITKKFGSLTALDSVSLNVQAGTIHAIVGENGAGKTTLMRILYGGLAADSGAIAIDGNSVQFSKSRDSIAAGVGMVSQHYAIIPELSCIQNLLVGAENGTIIDYHAAIKRATELAARMGFAFDWHAEAGTLSPAAAQKLEILKLLWRNARIMILDEPTAMLSPHDSENLFESIQKLVELGSTVILVTHRLPEVLDYCSSVTVLRGGKVVADLPVSETDGARLAELIVGEALVAAPLRTSPNLGPVVLEISSLVVVNERGNEALKSVDLKARTGEIIGIAGVDGSGQRELVQAILGTAKVKSGSVRVANLDSAATTAQRLAVGLRLVPEDRHEEGVVEEWSLEENAALGLQRLSPCAVGSTVDISARRGFAQRIADRFGTRHNGLKLPIFSLSGGNQQRFIAARALGCDPVVIIAFQPARGLDIKGSADVYAGIREAVQHGATALVISFDLDELLVYCDRVVAICNGTISVPPAGLELDRATVGKLMVGTA